MSLLRRAVNPIKRSHGRIVGLSRCCAKPASSISSAGNGADQGGCSPFAAGSFPLGNALFTRPLPSAGPFLANRSLSSQSGKKTTEDEDDLEEGFSDLEAPQGNGKAGRTEGEEGAEGIASGAELSGTESGDDSEEAEEALGLSDIEAEKNGGAPSPKKTSPSPLFKVIMEASPLSINAALDEWVNEGNPLGRSEIYSALLGLRRRRLFGKALQLFEWLDAKKRLSFVERDYASRLDLVAKVHGLYRAEKYLEKIPESCRGELVYRTLLASCVAAGRADKAEEVFNKMRDLGFPVTAFACNQLLVLYKRLNRKKIADVLLMMEKESVKPTLFTYRVLIDAKGRARDIAGMEKVVESMKKEGLEPDSTVRAVIARHYITSGLTEEAADVLKEMEGGGGGSGSEDRGACKSLLLLYAALGREADVERIWKLCEAAPRMDECLAAIEAWGKIGRVEAAEAVFEKMHKQFKKLSPRYYNSLLKVYGDHQLLAKGKELVKRMADGGCPIGPPTWDALVGMYVQVGEVEKADGLLQKAAAGQGKARPLHSSYMAVMEKYAERGEVHNTEKIFHRLRQSGYAGRMRHFQVLLQAYVNAKAPAYGFRERMKADNVFPNKTMAAQLAAADAFKKTQISELLD